jgi:filamentous hemagglutinin family protein
MARAGLTLGLLLAACGAWAQTGNLGLVVRDGSIGPEVPAGEDGVVLPGDGADYLIYQELGELWGSNLFHSFEAFSIGDGEIARFTGSPSIANIVSRVNGGTRSEILGELESTVPDANLFLLNPYGVFFGPNSELDVQGSFYASTADVLRFDEGPDFFARATTRPATLSSAPPAEFGFLQEPTGDITFDRAQLAVNEGRTLSAVGGEVLVFGGPSPSLAAPGGRVQLVSVASPGVNVPLDASELDVGGLVAGALGNVSLTDGAVLQVDSESGGAFGTGRIVIRGGQFVMLGGGLNARTNNAIAGDPTAVDVAVTGAVVIGDDDGSRATIQSFSRSTGGATGDIRFAADSVTLRDRARVVGQTSGAAPGAGVDVDANEVILESGGQIFTRSRGAGDAGTIAISGPAIEAEGESADRAESVTLAGGAQVFTRGDGDATGRGGRVELAAQSLEVTGDGTEVFSLSEGDSAGRVIHVAAGRVRVADGGRIFSEASGNEAGAAIEIVADGVGVADPEAFALEVTERGAITSLATADGAGGAIRIHAANARVSDDGQVASETRGGGPGGLVDVTADAELELASEGQITTLVASTARGRGGDLVVRAGSVKVTGGEDPDFVAQISALTESKGQLEGEGRGGDLTLEAGSVELIDGGQIRATTDGDAAAGHLTLTVREDLHLPSSNCDGVCIRGVSIGGARPSGIFATSGSDPDTPAAEQATGDGGDVVVNARFVRLESGGEIGASTLGKGNAGSLTIWNQGENAQLVSILGDPTGEKSVVATQGSVGSGGDLKIFADDLEFVDGGEASASTTDSGNSGSVVIEAQRVLIQGESSEGPSGVFAQTVSGVVSPGDPDNRAGDAGSIDITATESVRVLDRGVIAVRSNGGGFAGDIVIRGGGSVEVADGGEISADARGTIVDASLENASDIRIVDADQVIVASEGTIAARTFGSGFGGTIAVTATGVHLSENAQITAEGTDTGIGPGTQAVPAGDISITEADQVSLTSGATVTAETSGRNAGGSITVSGTDVSLSRGARITAASTSTADDAGDGGSITVRDTQNLSLGFGSTITAETRGKGQGGSIDIGAANVALSRSEITARSTADGGGDAGNIVIAAVGSFRAVNSAVTTTAEDAGGGRISLQAGQLVYLLDSRLETTVNGEQVGEDAGDIDIPLRGDEPDSPAPDVPEFVVINRSIIRANATATDAGDITIAGDEVLISSDSLIEAHSDLGVSGEIQISSPDADVVSQVTPLPSSFVDPSDRLLPPCAARTERTGSFVVQSREAIQPSPDAPLSPALAGSPGAAGAFPTMDSENCPVSEERS